MLGENEYYTVLGLNGCEHRTDIRTREQAMPIVKAFRAQGISLKSENGNGADHMQPASLSEDSVEEPSQDMFG